MFRLGWGLVLLAACEGAVGLQGETDDLGDTDTDTDSDTDSDTDTDSVADGRPVADAGGDLTVFVGERARLDGSGSFDPQGDPLAFQWTLEAQPGASWATLVDPQAEQASLTPDAPGAWRVRLRVDDGAEISEADFATVTAELPPFDGETFDPDHVWMLGTVSEGLCGREIVADPRRPDRGAVGFDCSTSGHVLHPDGRLVYSGSWREPPRVFSCDGDCIITKGADYPGRTGENDAEYPHPCKPEVDPVQAWRIGPEDSVFQCTRQVNTGMWLGARGEVAFELPSPARIVRPGTDGAVLYSTDGRSFRVFNRDTGSDHAITGLPEGQFVAVRSQPDGAFWVVVPDDDPDDDIEVALWKVASDGTADKVGDYPASPEGSWPPTLRAGQLDAKGALWQQGRGTRETFEDVILRRTIEGESAVVYSEYDEPFVKLHISYLITGP